MKLDANEYMYLECSSCHERMRLGKNKGSYWKEFMDSDDVTFESRLGKFLTMHGGCAVSDIGIVFE